jgi:cysteinyl-tRNA synthetase
MAASPQVTQEEYRELERGLREKIVEKATSDPEWMRKYVDSPDEALKEAAFPEADRIRETLQSVKSVNPQEDDVQGHHDYYYWYEVCYSYTTYYEYYWYYVDA